MSAGPEGWTRAKAILPPVGDQAGSNSGAGLLLRSDRPVPSDFTLKMSPLPARAEENATLPFVPGNAACAETGAARAVAATRRPAKTLRLLPLGGDVSVERMLPPCSYVRAETPLALRTARRRSCRACRRDRSREARPGRSANALTSRLPARLSTCADEDKLLERTPTRTESS